MVAGLAKHGCVNYLVDGFPRNENNKVGWEATMTDKTRILRVLVIDCPDEASFFVVAYLRMCIFSTESPLAPELFSIIEGKRVLVFSAS